MFFTERKLEAALSKYSVALKLKPFFIIAENYKQFDHTVQLFTTLLNLIAVYSSNEQHLNLPFKKISQFITLVLHKLGSFGLSSPSPVLS